MQSQSKNKELQLFILLASLFIAALITCNLIANKFVTINLGFKTFIVSVGILPYPLTFLITDILSEIYGQKMTNRVVASGFIASLMVLCFLWIGSQPNALPDKLDIQIKHTEEVQRNLEIFKEDAKNFNGIKLIKDTTVNNTIKLEWEFDRFKFTDDDLEDFKNHLKLKNLNPIEEVEKTFGTPVNNEIYNTVFQNAWRVMAASMIAYLFAQFLDVRLFHFWKKLTQGRHLWLRNNASTICSQLVDTTLVICVLFIGVKPGSWIMQAIIDGWLFKTLCAFIDTPIFYAISAYLRKKFNLKLGEEVSL